MKATIINTNAAHLTAAHRKENNFREEYAAFYIDEAGEMRTLVTLRIYSTESRAYACCWISCGYTQVWTRGSGYAGGCGYHRASAAASNALYAAGASLSDDISGRGDSAIIEAVKAVGECLVIDRFPVYVHHAHA